VEITDKTIKEQAKVVMNLGIEVEKLKQQGVAGYQQQLKQMEDVMISMVKHTEEKTILDHMVKALGESRASARIKDITVPVPDNEGPS